jgi:hypothetical protein
MSQTPRTFAELLAAFANNDSKGITALRLRDFVESAMGCYGSMFVDGGSAPEGLTTTPQKLTGWTSAGASRNVTPDPVTNNRLEIGATGIYDLSFSASFQLLTALDAYTFEARANGTKLPGFSARFSGAPPGTVVPISFGPRPVELVDGDDIEIYAYSDAAAGDILLVHAQVAVSRVG